MRHIGSVGSTGILVLYFLSAVPLANLLVATRRVYMYTYMYRYIPLQFSDLLVFCGHFFAITLQQSRKGSTHSTPACSLYCSEPSLFARPRLTHQSRSADQGPYCEGTILLENSTTPIQFLLASVSKFISALCEICFLLHRMHSQVIAPPITNTTPPTLEKRRADESVDQQPITSGAIDANYR